MTKIEEIILPPDTQANKPAASLEGRLYFATDGDLQRDNGSTWDTYQSTTGGGGGVLAKIYDFTITGSDQASIDTNVDGSTVPDFAGHDVLSWYFIGRTDDAGANAGMNINVNNDTGAKYDQQLAGANDTAVAGATILGATAWTPNISGGGSAANYATVLRMTIPAYTDTTFFKVGEFTTGKTDTTAGNNFGRLWIASFQGTAAIARLKVAAQGAAKLKVGSRLIVYGQ